MKSNGDKNKNLWLDEFLNKIEPYFRNIIIDPHNSDTWKIQLTTANNFTSSKEHIMHSRGGNIKFATYNDANEIVDELFESFRYRYQEHLET